MRAVIVEIKKHRAAALTQDGQIIIIRNKNYVIGQVMELKRDKAAKFRKKLVWATSAAAVICTFSVGAWMFFSPYTYVSLDVNPSVEYSVNRFNLVLSAQGVNEDGEEILENLHLQYRSINNAIIVTVAEIESEGYFEGEEPGGVIIATSSEDEEGAEELADELEEEIDEELDEDVEVEALSVGKERVLEARALGITPGKLNLIEKLQASSDDPENIKVEDWMNKSVKEIMKTIKENKKNQKLNTTDTTDDEETKTQKTNNNKKIK